MINVLLALAWSNHPHHEIAHEWFRRDAHVGWATCLFTQSGFLRLSMNPRAVEVAIRFQTARSLLDGLTAHAGHRFHDHAPSAVVPVFDDLAARITNYR